MLKFQRNGVASTISTVASSLPSLKKLAGKLKQGGGGIAVSPGII